MKTTILKRLTPVAVFVLAVTGAFFTTSMQTAAESELIPEIGYVDLNNGGSPCDLPVECDDQGDDICRQFGETGPQAWGMDNPTSCTKKLFRPD